MSTVLIELKRDWYGPDRTRRRKANNPHAIPAAWLKEDKDGRRLIVPSDAEVVEEQELSSQKKRSGSSASKPARPLDATDAIIKAAKDASRIDEANVGIAEVAISAAPNKPGKPGKK